MPQKTAFPNLNLATAKDKGRRVDCSNVRIDLQLIRCSTWESEVELAVLTK